MSPENLDGSNRTDVYAFNDEDEGLSPTLPVTSFPIHFLSETTLSRIRSEIDFTYITFQTTLTQGQAEKADSSVEPVSLNYIMIKVTFE